VCNIREYYHNFLEEIYSSKTIVSRIVAAVIARSFSGKRKTHTSQCNLLYVVLWADVNADNNVADFSGPIRAEI
jgi:hypothetical protein